MYTPTQIEAIKMFGRKELTEGCLFKYRKGWDDDILTFCSIYDDTGGTNTLSYLPPDKESTWEINEFSENTEIEIIGHIPHLEDIFRVAEEKGWFLELQGGVMSIHFRDRTYTSFKYEGSISLINQPEETLKQLINLFK